MVYKCLYYKANCHVGIEADTQNGGYRITLCLEKKSIILLFNLVAMEMLLLDIKQNWLDSWFIIESAKIICWRHFMYGS